MRRCIYPGTFDPMTNGHLDIVKRALKVFDEVVVAIAANEAKKPLFSLERRLELTRLCVGEFGGRVSVRTFDNLLVDFARQNGVNVVVRGLRAVSDFEYELQMGYVNESLSEDFESVYFVSNLKHSFISSSIVRTLLSHGGDISKFVPEAILHEVKRGFER